MGEYKKHCSSYLLFLKKYEIGEKISVFWDSEYTFFFTDIIFNYP